MLTKTPAHPEQLTLFTPPDRPAAARSARPQPAPPPKQRQPGQGGRAGHAPKRQGKQVRPYSLKYTAAGTPRRYLLSGIPAGLWIRARARAKREHRAMRQVILELVDGWTRRPE